MASGGHVLLQQRSALETKIKTITNQDLKEICKHWSYQVSGTKIILQRRALEILDNLISTGDVKGIHTLKYRFLKYKPSPHSEFDVGGSGQMASASASPSYSSSNGRVSSGLDRMPPGGKFFKPSPFYEIIDVICRLSDLPEMPQNRHTVRQSITLSAEQAQKLTVDKSIKLLLYCGLANAISPPHHLADISFPNQIEVKINNDDVRSNFKGLKNKPGSTKPAELTNFRPKPGYANQLSITYALTQKRYAYIVYMVKYISATTLTERIKNASVIPKQMVIDEMNKANADPDIEATSTRMSLKDPISTVRISLPVRSTICKHNQCFDGAMFMQLQEQAPQWSCPVCSKIVPFQSLCVDKYFEDILNRTPSSIEKVDVEPNGEWRVIKEDDDRQPNGTSNKPRASYDDDFDDDLVEVPDPTNKPVQNITRDSQQRSSFSPGGLGGFPLTTPPLSSREASVSQSAASAQRPSNKRPASAVIDLTLSDDEEDEPPRPAKRQQTSALHQSGSSQSYHTPTSIPEPSRYQGWYRPAPSQGYRSMNGSAVPPSPHARLPGSPTQSYSQSPVMRSNGFSAPTPDWSSNPPARQTPQQFGGLLSNLNGHTDRERGYTPQLAQQQQQPPPPRTSLSPQDTRGLRLPPMQPSRLDSYQHGGWRGDNMSSSGSPGQ